MLYQVDFAISVKGAYQDIYQAFIFAMSLKEAKAEAEEIKAEVLEGIKQKIHVFIGDPAC
ncbi:Arm DNA-binding domain-containing protein [Niallia nealsonii]|uniref:Uncharacterized protein n=1 Tax=Niallia nealsonii TaxID=115979 RepID=A0A2N0Z352_9BACI|nr:Arm DNA-binding domain-containing protein [Niallia nealsonii]PKG23930.1 hypothetical protein CWS01_09155 [Niallia nealsonii]